MPSAASKITHKMILNRIKSFLEPLLRANQNRLHHGRLNITHFLAITRIIKGGHNNNFKAIALFFNLQKVFNSFHCGKMMTLALYQLVIFMQLTIGFAIRKATGKIQRRLVTGKAGVLL